MKATKKIGYTSGTSDYATTLDYIEIPDSIEKEQRYFNGSQTSYGLEDNAWLDYQKVVQNTLSNLDTLKL